jgi:hypothetical protein
MKCFGCEVLARPLYHAAENSPHTIDLELLDKGLHNVSANLHTQLQTRINAVEDGKYNFILLAYGLCGLSLHGIKSASLPLVIPKAHDCITLFLGSRNRYMEEFQKAPGTYWYTLDYLERNVSGSDPIAMGVSYSMDLEKMYSKYVEKYGQEKADFLMEAMNQWETHYDRAAYIDLHLGDGARIENLAKEEATKKGWKFEQLDGDISIIQKLLHGKWDDDFVVIQPGNHISFAYNEDIIESQKDTLESEKTS